MIPATIHRPCKSWPRPGMKKLASAAITFPQLPLFIEYLLPINLCKGYAEFMPQTESG
jgi:hypothetical protein